MSFCIKCGNKLPDEAIFCGNCGFKIPMGEMKKETINQPAPIADETALQPESVTEGETLENKEEACSECSVQTNAQMHIEEITPLAKDEQTQEDNAGYTSAYTYPVIVPKKKKPILLISIVSILVIAVCITSIFVFSNDQGSPKKTVNKYVEAVVDGDAEEIIEIMYPKSIIRRIVSDRDMTMEEFEESLEDNLEYMEDKNREMYGRNLRGRVRILSSETLDREEVRNREERIKASYDVNIDISRAVKLECELTLSGSRGSEVDEETITLYKIGKKWYVLEMI